MAEFPTTFAERLNEKHQGRRLAGPFAVTIVSGGIAVYRAANIGLVTWASNGAAGKAYVYTGAELVTSREGRRPTQIPEEQGEDGMRPDARLYMGFPHTLESMA